MVIKAEGFVVLTLKFEREGDQWVGTCVELGTSTFANRLPQAIKELDSLVTEHLNALERVGERERFFKEWGIQFHKSMPKPMDVHHKQPDPDWARFIQTALASHPRTSNVRPQGPFYQPGVYPVEPTAALANAGV